MQAAFQLLALQATISCEVQGIIVNVIDKPRVYTPKRKCKSCAESYDFGLWTPVQDNKWKCPQCESTQELKPYKPKAERKFNFWRFLVTRTTRQLEIAEQEIATVAHDMQEFTSQTDLSGPFYPDALPYTPNRENCVHPITYKPCQYFEPHEYGFDTKGHPDFVQVEDYLGL